MAKRKLKKLRASSEKNIVLYNARVSQETTHNKGFNGQCSNIFCGETDEKSYDWSLGGNVVCPPGMPHRGALNIVCGRVNT